MAGKFRAGVQKFMSGRYGTDKLNTWILVGGVILCIVGLFMPIAMVRLALILSAYGLMGWSLFRTFSRNTYKRYRENRRFLLLLDRFKDREHRYFDCPKCRQSVRVPRKKGKIAITCPKCKEKFVRKT